MPKLINENLEKNLKEKWEEYNLYFLENYDEEIYLDTNEEPFLFKDKDLKPFDFEKNNSYLNLVKQDETFYDFLNFMPKNTVYCLHLQEPDKHPKEYYPHLRFYDKPRVIVMGVLNNKTNKLCEPDFNIEPFKSRCPYENYYRLYYNLENLDSISSGFMGVEIVNNKTFESEIILSPSYKVLENFKLFEKLDDEDNLLKTLYQFFIRGESEIFVEQYPIYKKDVKNIFERYTSLSNTIETLIEKDTREFPENLCIDRWLKRMVSYKADKQNIKLNIWRSFKFCEISYEEFKNISINL